MIGKAISSGSTAASMSATVTANEVSPQSIVFGLLALVLYAMTQPSILSGRSPRLGVLIPHRSSPFLCLIDTVVLMTSGIYGLMELLRRKWSLRWAGMRHQTPHDLEERRAIYKTDKAGCSSEYEFSDRELADSHPRPRARTFKLLIFVLVVIPQAMRLFSMQGIAYTQAWAAVFFVSSLVSSVAELTGVEFSNPPLGSLIESLQHPGRAPLSNRARRYGAKGSKLITVLFFVFCAICYVVVVSWVWYQVATSVRFSGGRLVHLLNFINLVVLLLCWIRTSVLQSCFANFRMPWLMLRLPSADLILHYCIGFGIVLSYFEPQRIFQTASIPYLLESLLRFNLSIFTAVAVSNRLARLMDRIMRSMTRLGVVAQLPFSKYQIRPIDTLILSTMLREINHKIKHRDEEMPKSISQNVIVFEVLEKMAKRTGFDIPPNAVGRMLSLCNARKMQSDSISLQSDSQFAGNALSCHQDFASSKWRALNLTEDSVAWLPGSTSQAHGTQGQSDGIRTMLDGYTSGNTRRPLYRPYWQFQPPRENFMALLYHGKMPLLDLQDQYPVDVEWVGFSIFNFLTAVIYYLCVFNSKGP